MSIIALSLDRTPVTSRRRTDAEGMVIIRIMTVKCPRLWNFLTGFESISWR
jgi:hypothetical protein